MLTCTAAGPRAAADPLAEIRAETRTRSRAMEWVRALTASHRLTGSPELDVAGSWVERQLKELDFANVHVERWPFERRWTVTASDVEIVEPLALKVATVPQTWSPGTHGVQTGPLRGVRLSRRGEIESGTEALRGAFVLVQAGIPDDLQNRVQQSLRDAGVVATLERSVGSDDKVI